VKIMDNEKRMGQDEEDILGSDDDRQWTKQGKHHRQFQY
jgi:hypothetical protein